MPKKLVSCPVRVKTKLNIKFESPIAVGIDVSKDTLMICYRYASSASFVKEIGNNDADIKLLIKELLSYNFTGKIVSESTGRFHMLSAVLLTEKNFSVYVINPLMSKKYNAASIRKVKSDKRDAEILAEIAIKEEKLPEKFSASRNMLMIKKKISLIASLDKQIQSMQASIREYQETAKTLKVKLGPVEKKMFKTAAELVKDKKQLEQDIKDIVTSETADESSQKRQAAFVSIPGVSPYVAALATIFFQEEYCQSAKQWIAYIGYDISVRQSGKWVGKGKLTKRGNGYMRKRFFLAAWGAMMHNEQFKNYYEQLRAKKHTYVESLVIIARKIIRIMFNLSKNNSMYDQNKIVFA